MKEEEFRKALKKRGKKEHVVEELISSFRLFEEYLKTQRKRELDEATEEDLRNYAASCEAGKKGSAKIRIRGVMLYYDISGNKPMASLAAEIRQADTAKKRAVFKLKDFLWVNEDHVARLKKAGITDINQMLEACKTPETRKKLAAETGIGLDGILELVKLSNLARLFAVKGIRARLYHDARVDTWETIARWEPEEFRNMLVKFVENTGFPGIPPIPREAAYTIASAKKMPRIIEW